MSRVTLIQGLAPRVLLRRVVLGLAAVEGVVVAATYGYEWVSLRAAENQVTYNWTALDGPTWWHYENDGVRRPSIVPAARARINDGEPVIGVAIGPAARAYRIKALLDPKDHLINDMVGVHPVSVAYCDLSDCARAFTGRETGAPLRISLAGLRDLDMILRVGSTLYFQKDGHAVDSGPDPPAFPFDKLPLVRTTWGNWKRLHPMTDIYLGPKD